jgi:hypothetical protein
MMAIVAPNSLCTRICDALGLSRVRSLTLHMEVNSVVTVDAEFFPNSKQLEDVAEELETKRYILIENPEQTG